MLNSTPLPGLAVTEAATPLAATQQYTMQPYALINNHCKWSSSVGSDTNATLKTYGLMLLKKTIMVAKYY